VVAQTLADRAQKLVLDAQSGSQVAFTELYDLYSYRVYRTVLRITKNAADAEDALQESFFRAFQAINRFDGRAKFSSWLTRIAINCALIALRSHRSRPQHSNATNLEWEDAVEIIDPSMSPEETCYQHQLETSFDRAVQNLPPQLREIVEERLMKDGSTREVAQRLNISEAATKTRLRRARVQLGAVCSTETGVRTLTSRLASATSLRQQLRCP
jgi:RNA polymerase sigma-70 factor (ECF subfamily)